MGDLNLLILATALALLAVILVIGVWVPGPLEDLLHSAASVMGR